MGVKMNDSNELVIGTSQGGFKVKLERIEGEKKSKLRTTEIEGYCDFLPIIGNQWKMFSTPLEKDKDIRIIITTKVEKYIDFDLPIVIFKTKNSIYKLTVFF